MIYDGCLSNVAIPLQPLTAFKNSFRFFIKEAELLYEYVYNKWSTRIFSQKIMFSVVINQIIKKMPWGILLNQFLIFIYITLRQISLKNIIYFARLLRKISLFIPQFTFGATLLNHVWYKANSNRLIKFLKSSLLQNREQSLFKRIISPLIAG